MKKLIAILLAFAVVLSMMIVPSFAEDDNVLEDPCIDNDEILTAWPNGWAAGIAQEWSPESVTDDGSGSIHLENSAEAPNQHCTQPIFLEGGKTYIISGWIKVENFHCNCLGACGAYFCIHIPSASGTPSGTFTASTGYKDTNDVLEGWNYFENTYTPANDEDTFFSLCLWGSQGDAYFDNLYIGEAGSPYKPLDPIYLSDLEAKSWVTYHAQSDDENPQYNAWFNRQEGLNANGNTNILIGGKEYEKGIQVHASDEERHKNGDGYATAEVVYDISAYTNQYNAFKCVFGGLTQVDSTVVGDNHTNYTEIYIDGELAFVSEETDNTKTLDIAVYIPEGSKEIRLVSVAGEEFNSEWYAWADARLVKDDSLKPAEPEPTEAPADPTEAPADPTTAPEATDAPADPTTAPSDEPDEKKGCGSVIVSGTAVTAVAMAAAVIVLKKKH